MVIFVAVVVVVVVVVVPPEGYAILSQVAVTNWEETTFIFSARETMPAIWFLLLLLLFCFCLFVCLFSVNSDPADYLT